MWVKFILLLSGDLNPRQTPPTRNYRLWEFLPFHNSSFPTEWIDYHLDSMP